MILNLKHFSFFKDNGQKWIYFGPSYQKLHTLAKKSTSQRLFIRDRHLLSFLKENYLKGYKEPKIVIHFFL